MSIAEKAGARGKAAGLLILAIGLSLSLMLSFLSIRHFLGWRSLGNDEKALLTAADLSGGNPTYHHLLGKFYLESLESPDLRKAAFHYRQSIRGNPLQAGVWIDLARTYQGLGEEDAAARALERAVRLSPSNPSLLWEAGTFWLMRGRTGEALASLKAFLLLEQAGQRDVYDLCWKLGVSNRDILALVLPEGYIYHAGYLMYLVGSGRVPEAEETWKQMRKDELEKRVFLSYVNFLIDNRRYETSWQTWEEIIGRVEGLEKASAGAPVWNGGFEHDILGGGYGWILGRTEGMQVFIDESVRMTGYRSLGVAFDGNHNPDITIAQQVVRVAPEVSYSLRGFIKTDTLTTTNGILIQVLGHKCAGLSRKSDIITGTTFWQEVSVDFVPPPGCSAILLRIRRERSDKLDNRIAGTAWIDGISLKQQTAPHTSSSKQP